MFKRIERKRKRREEVEQLGLDEEGLNDTDSDETDSGSDSEQRSTSSDGGGGDDDDDDAPISVAEALKDPIYPISLDHSVYGCVLCKGKLIKNAGAAIAHKNSRVHMRRFERFELLSADADPDTNAWGLVRTTQARSSVQPSEPGKPSTRGLKRQARQAAVREKRKRHKALRAKAISKKSLKNQSDANTGPDLSAEVSLRDSPEPRNPRETARKKQRLENKTLVKSHTRTKDSKNGKRSILKVQRRPIGHHNLVGP